jgi:hypothetical protein
MAGIGGCVFCGGGPLSAEHVFSRRWIARFSPGATSHTHELVRSVAPGEPDLCRTYTTKSPEGMVVSGAVCVRCNNGWMNDLDLAVQPLLNAIVDGADVAVSADERRLLATWACKIALVMYSGTGDGTLPAHVFRAFASQPSPLPGALVLLANQAEIDGETHQTATPLYAARDAWDEAAAFAATFRIQHLVGQVRLPLSLGLSPEVRSEDADLVVRLWPDDGPATWPPARAIEDEEAFRRFAFRSSLDESSAFER